MDAHASGVGRSTCDHLPAQKFPRSAQQIFHTAAVLVVVVSYCLFVIRNREPDVHASSAGVCGSISDVAVVLVVVSYLLVDRNIS